ncbi:hypothetical protein C8R46DRAFT_1222180 [Mycena filopes]|nr:hypothetical protein C8R46DRAFT_1222180 [Mycena filopes]
MTIFCDYCALPTTMPYYMFFYNPATHCIPRETSLAKVTRLQPFHLTYPTPRVPAHPSLELHPGSEPLPRPFRSQAGPVHFSLPSGTTDSPTVYVCSWPPSLPVVDVPAPSSASSYRSHFSSSSVYCTPPTTPSPSATYTPRSSAPSTPDSDLGVPRSLCDVDVGHESALERTKLKPVVSDYGRRELRPTGLARLRPNAPPALKIKAEKTAATLQSKYIDEAEGLVMLLWPPRQPTAAAH